MIEAITLHVNGDDYHLALDTSTTLVDALRDHMGLTGVKKSCDEGECGACTVLMDGKCVASCTYLAVDAQGHDIVTIEGLKGRTGGLHPLQQAFIDCFAVQCGFCTPGMIMACVSLLSVNPNPTEDEIRDYLRGNICRCTGYNKIIDAVHQAAQVLAAEKEAD